MLIAQRHFPHQRQYLLPKNVTSTGKPSPCKIWRWLYVLIRISKVRHPRIMSEKCNGGHVLRNRHVICSCMSQFSYLLFKATWVAIFWVSYVHTKHWSSSAQGYRKFHSSTERRTFESIPKCQNRGQIWQGCPDLDLPRKNSNKHCKSWYAHNGAQHTEPAWSWRDDDVASEGLVKSTLLNLWSKMPNETHEFALRQPVEMNGCCSGSKKVAPDWLVRFATSQFKIHKIQISLHSLHVLSPKPK